MFGQVLPPPDPPRIEAVVHRHCKADDSPCHFEVVVDALDALNGLRASSSLASVMADHPLPSDSPLGHEPDLEALAQAVRVVKEMYQL